MKLLILTSTAGIALIGALRTQKEAVSQPSDQQEDILNELDELSGAGGEPTVQQHSDAIKDLETIVNDDTDAGASHSMRSSGSVVTEDCLMDDFLNSMKEYENGDGDESFGALDHLVGGGDSSSNAVQELGNAQQAFAACPY